MYVISDGVLNLDCENTVLYVSIFMSNIKLSDYVLRFPNTEHFCGLQYGTK